MAGNQNMMQPPISYQHPEYAFPRYLAAKKSVDDRALNYRVWRALADELAGRSDVAPPRVLELGAGSGSMIERLLDGGMLRGGSYDAVDNGSENLDATPASLENWSATRPWTVSREGNRVFIEGDDADALTVRLIPEDAFRFLDRPDVAGGYDLVIAHAFLDLVDLARILPHIRRALRPRGLLYATINFDGVTAFEPILDAELDRRIEELYHATMDARMVDGSRSGDSRTGRRLIHQLQHAGFSVEAAGPSDWLVFAQNGAYPNDETYFLHFIVNTVHSALAGHPELDAPAFDAWIAARHQQIERGELVYLAHQIDVLGRSLPDTQGQQPQDIEKIPEKGK